MDFTNYQKAIHAVSHSVNRALLGGRGSAKTTAWAQDIWIKSEYYGKESKYLFLRQGPYRSMGNVISTLNQIFDAQYGPNGHGLSQARGSWTWNTPTGAHIELGILPDGDAGMRYYEKTYQGRDFTTITIDEAQQWARPAVLDRIQSNLRGSIPRQVNLSANPGGPGHQWLYQRFMAGKEPWRPFDIEVDIKLHGKIKHTSKRWICCPGTYLDNPHNGPKDEYLANLAASCHDDPELLKAWITGSWKISRGAYFSASLDNPYTEINWPTPADWGRWDPRGWIFWLTHDHGTAKPSVTYVMARSPGAEGPDGLYYPAESLAVADEYACHRPGDLASGFNWAVPRVAEGIKMLAERWKIPAEGVADDACFSEHGHELTIADEYSAAGVVWSKANKGRRAPRFLVIKRLLSNCGSVEEPALYISIRCEYFWATVPFLLHDPRDPDVVKKCDTDHGLDALSYGLEGDYVGNSFMPM